VQVSGPIRSRYSWKGVLEDSTEWICSIKTLATHYSAVEAAIREIHAYDEPEIVAVAISHASTGYAAWVSQSVAGESER
jgi:periplasmic divalent cation tolerance protein